MNKNQRLLPAVTLALALIPALALANSGDFSGGVAIGTSYAGVSAAPTSGLIVQGQVAIGTSSPAVSLDVSKETDALALPSGTTAQRPSGVNGMVRYNSTLQALEAYINGVWTSLAGSSSTAIVSAGQLQCGGGTCSTTGSTTLNYCPYKGNVKSTAAQGNYTIPSACLSATTTSMYVGGTAGSSVTASTLYYIYLWNTSGTWVLDAETTGHATDSSTGIEIKSGDNTKTLVGMIHVDGSKKVMSRGQTSIGGDTNTVATWDNRQPTATKCNFTTTRTTTSSASQTEINSENRCLFMNWGDGAAFAANLTGFSNTAGGGFSTDLWLDSTSGAFIASTGLIQNTASQQATLLLGASASAVVEGFHFTVLSAQVNAGTTVSYTGGTPEGESVFTIQ